MIRKHLSIRTFKSLISTKDLREALGGLTMLQPLANSRIKKITSIYSTSIMIWWTNLMKLRPSKVINSQLNNLWLHICSPNMRPWPQIKDRQTSSTKTCLKWVQKSFQLVEPHWDRRASGIETRQMLTTHLSRRIVTRVKEERTVAEVTTVVIVQRVIVAATKAGESESKTLIWIFFLKKSACR